MRLYLVANRYSIGIQAGIQAGHVIPELYEKFLSPKWNPEYRENLHKWATKHKTIMLLRTFGGDESIEELYAALAKPARELHLPFALFREAALRNSASACGVVVPTEYYTGDKELLPAPLQALHAALDPLPFAT